MKRRLLGIVTALVLSSAAVVAIAPAPNADAAIYYECRKYSWWWGWSIVHTTDWHYYTDRGYTCYCIGTLTK